jgi:hypothetical protein
MAGLRIMWPTAPMPSLGGALAEYVVQVENTSDPDASGEASVPAGTHEVTLPFVPDGHYKVYVQGKDATGADVTERLVTEVDVPGPTIVDAPTGVQATVIP